MVAGGSEDSFCPTSIHSSIKMQAMNTKKFERAAQSSRPFDKQRAGFVLSEGSGVVVLEDLEHAVQRGARIYCELLGYGCSCKNAEPRQGKRTLQKNDFPLLPNCRNAQSIPPGYEAVAVSKNGF